MGRLKVGLQGLGFGGAGLERERYVQLAMFAYCQLLERQELEGGGWPPVPCSCAR